MPYSRNSSNRSGEGFRPRFNDRGPVEMHKAICDNCGKECEVPFRPTNGKPIFCSNCFENQRADVNPRRSEGRNFDRSTNVEEKQMFNAVCADCGDNCQVPFQPSGDKPVFCSNCFGDKKSGGSRNAQPKNPQFDEQLDTLNSKLDRILNLLSPVVPIEEVVKKKASTKKSSVK